MIGQTLRATADDVKVRRLQVVTLRDNIHSLDN
jgi:hypothetical protein